jgi:hypothetical protein
MDNDSGRLVPARDAEALARGLEETLSYLWDAPAIASRHSRSWADVASDVEMILEAVHSGTPSPLVSR